MSQGKSEREKVLREFYNHTRREDRINILSDQLGTAVVEASRLRKRGNPREGIKLLEPLCQQSGGLGTIPRYQHLTLTSWLELARCYEKAHRPVDALKAINAAEKINEKHPAILVTLSRLYAMGGKFAKAEQMLEEALQQDNRRYYIKILRDVGVMRSLQGNLKGATESFQTVLEVDPCDVTALYGSGLIAQASGNEQQAEGFFTRSAASFQFNKQGSWSHALLERNKEFIAGGGQKILPQPSVPNGNAATPPQLGL